MAESDNIYYARRMLEEQAKASSADRDDIRMVHIKLIELYQDRINRLEATELASKRPARFRPELRIVPAIANFAS